MIQLIGLIIATYAMARLVQVPLEMSANEPAWLSLPFGLRVAIVAGVSALGLGVLMLLTLALLMSGGPQGGM